MKKYIIILAIAASGFLLSCNDKLDLTSDGRIPMKEVFSDRWKTMGWLNGCYGYCPGLSFNRSAFTDEAHHADAGTSNGVGYYNFYSGSVSANSWVASDGQVWASLFQGIRKCNVFLANIGTAQISASETERAKWTAQAHTLRALYYWQLVKRYGGVPIFKTEVGLEHDFSADRRASFSECVAFIIEDCRAALTASTEAFPWIETSDRAMTRGIPYAIMSEAVLYAASPKWNDGAYSWADAAATTKEAVDACMGQGGFALYETAPEPKNAQNAYAYFHILIADFQRATDKETIFAHGGRQSVWRYAGLPTNDRMETAGPCPTQELVDAYETVGGIPVLNLEEPYIGGDHTKPNYNPDALAAGYDPAKPYEKRDPRFYASIYYNGAERNLETPGTLIETFTGGKEGMTPAANQIYTRTGYYLRKFNNWRSGNGNEADGAVRMFHLSELLLNYAEAANEAYGPQAVPVGGGLTAAQAINKVRSRAGMPDITTADQKIFRFRCRNERRVELAFEEHRYFDVRRWGILDQTDKTVTGMQITKAAGTGKLTYNRVKVSDRKCYEAKYYLYPISQGEVDKANNNTGVQWQNPGWEQ